MGHLLCDLDGLEHRPPGPRDVLLKRHGAKRDEVDGDELLDLLREQGGVPATDTATCTIHVLH